MDGLWWPLDVPKECGLGTDMIHSARTCPLLLNSILTPGICSAMRQVLNLRMVTQCAMLEDFNIFLVLADQVRDDDFRLLV